MGRKGCALVLACVIPFITGCWNGHNTAIRFGDVSIGQQLIDLKRALDERALSPEEYERTKQTLLALSEACGDVDSAED